MRRLAFVVVILSAMFAAAGSIALAHKARIDTSVSLAAPAGSATTFTGTVTAKGGCKKGRAVSLFRTDEYSGRTLVGTATTDTSGAFSITPNPASTGSYQATVAKKKVKKGKTKSGKTKHKHKCLAGSSPAIAYAGAGSTPTPPPDY